MIAAGGGALVWSNVVPSNLGVQFAKAKSNSRDVRHSNPSTHTSISKNLEQTNEQNKENTIDIPSTFYKINNIAISELLHRDPGCIIFKIAEYSE